jgi:hypothetical protein
MHHTKKESKRNTHMQKIDDVLCLNAAPGNECRANSAQLPPQQHTCTKDTAHTAQKESMFNWCRFLGSSHMSVALSVSTRLDLWCRMPRRMVADVASITLIVDCIPQEDV